MTLKHTSKVINDRNVNLSSMYNQTSLKCNAIYTNINQINVGFGKGLHTIV